MTTSNILKLFRQEVKFIAGAKTTEQIPKLFLPEIAFVGKSNVGKSSLINAVCNHRGLAKVSHTPGRTQQINFFSFTDRLVLVDLPGYGFAKVPRFVQQQWQQLISYYLKQRFNLKLVNLLVDARRGIKPPDLEMAQLLTACNKNFQLVFTKVDKVSFTAEQVKKNQIFLASLGYSCNVIYTSSRSGEGAKELQFSFGEYIK